MQKIQKDHGTFKKQKEEKKLGDTKKKNKALSTFSTEDLLEILQKGQKPFRIDHILRILNVSRRQKEQVEAALYELVDSGNVVRMHGGQWISSAQVPVFIGRYSVQRSGVGFVDMARPENSKAPSKSKHMSSKKSAEAQSIFVHPSQAGEAWHGDMVRVALLPGRSGFKKGPEGRIIAVVERKAQEIMVRVGDAGSTKTRGVRRERREKGSALRRAHTSRLEHGNFIMGTPCDVRFSFGVRIDAEHIPSEILNEITPNSLLLVRPLEQIATNLWTAEAISAHGREDDVAVQEELVKINHQTPKEFPDSALHEAELLPRSPRAEDYAHRLDARELHFVTIDGETAKDFDDAIYVESPQTSGKKNWSLRVAIADVTHYVPLNSALDKEAKIRGNSWYFPRSVEPMFPFKLSNGLCSLNPHEDRLVMVAEMHFAPDGAMHKSKFYPAVICSKARLTYTEVKACVIDNEPKAQAAMTERKDGKRVLSMLTEAETLARILAKKRVDRGALNFNRPEPAYIFDDHGHIDRIERKEEHFAHQLIEEFMIAANEAVAEFLEEKGAEHLYRVHPEPEALRLTGLFQTLATTALAASIPPRPKASDLQQILHKAAGSDAEYIVSRLALRTMPQARYQPENTGHYGLASTCYCHFTSPIRRYADMVVHRALKAVLRKQKNFEFADALSEEAQLPTGYKLQALGDGLNLCERAAMEAEREMARRLAVLVLQGHEGQQYEGIIGAVSDFGIFVELDSMPVEGMVRISDLGDDFFEYDTQRQELIGAMSGIRYALGQRVQVRLVDVNLGRLEITFTLVQSPKSKKQQHALPRKQAAKLRQARSGKKRASSSLRRRK